VRRLALLAAIAGCAGAGGGGPAAPPSGQATPAGSSEPSIGALAASQGGLTMLGGGANRSQAEKGHSEGGLRAHAMDAAPKLDGVPREFGALTPAGVVVKAGAPGVEAPHFAAAVAYDKERLYLAGEVGHDTLAPTDHAELALAIPVGGGAFAAYTLALAPGRPGETAGSVRFATGARKGQDVPGARIVEAPASHGLTYEAAVPWSTFPEARLVRVGLRASMRWVDASRGIVATGNGDASAPRELPLLPTEAEIALADGLLGPRGLEAASPKIEVYANVTSDATKEKVAVYGHLLTVCGPGYRAGRQFFFRDMGGEVLSVEARELSAKGRDDLLVRLRVTTGATARELFQVLSFTSDEPETVFQQEIAVSSGAKRVSNALMVTSGRDVEVRVEPATGWDPATFREPLAAEGEPLLLPWGTVRARVYRFDGKRFARAREEAQPGIATAQAGTAPASVAAVRAADPPTPPVKKGGDLGAALLEQFRRDRAVPEGTRARFDLAVNVAEDARPERVLLVGRDVVVLGPGFRGGAGYAFLTLSQFAAEEDVKDLSARDLTGSGTADVVVRGVRRTSGVEVDALFVYQVRAGAITRTFAIETGREQEGKRVQGMVQFVPARSGKGFDVDARPGRATGWAQATYPWPQEQPGSGPVEPLLLPWGGIPAVRYAWNGTAFARAD